MVILFSCIFVINTIFVIYVTALDLTGMYYCEHELDFDYSLVIMTLFVDDEVMMRINWMTLVHCESSLKVLSNFTFYMTSIVSMCEFFEEMSCMRCFCSCIWGNPDPGPVRLRDVQQVVLDTSKMGEHFKPTVYQQVLCRGGA